METSLNKQERVLGAAIAAAYLWAMQVQKTSLKEAEMILPLCQVSEEGTSLWDLEDMHLPFITLDMVLL